MLAEGSDHFAATNGDFVMVVFLFDIRITARPMMQDVSASQKTKRQLPLKEKFTQNNLFTHFPGYSFHMMKIKRHMGY